MVLPSSGTPPTGEEPEGSRQPARARNPQPSAPDCSPKRVSRARASIRPVPATNCSLEQGRARQRTPSLPNRPRRRPNAQQRSLRASLAPVGGCSRLMYLKDGCALLVEGVAVRHGHGGHKPGGANSPLGGGKASAQRSFLGGSQSRIRCGLSQAHLRARVCSASPRLLCEPTLLCETAFVYGTSPAAAPAPSRLCQGGYRLRLRSSLSRSSSAARDLPRSPRADGSNSRPEA